MDVLNWLIMNWRGVLFLLQAALGGFTGVR